jgi:beta-lactamase superfamily II metal-dependent hydrolase
MMMSDVHDTTETYYDLLDAVAAKNKKITVVKPGDTYSLGGAQLTILAPVGNYEDLNDMSVVIRLCYKKISFLFTGDASKDSEEDMLKENRDLSADVLKVGHHGSSTATTPEFLKAVHPKYAVISVGAGNRYGLPDSSVINELKAAGVIILRTDIDGTIVFYSDGNNITYKMEKNGGNINESS